MSAGNTPTASVVSAGRPVRVTVWGENRVEQTDPDVGAVYPDGMHETIAAALRSSATASRFGPRRSTSRITASTAVASRRPTC